MSERRIAANRRNARKSTGPRSSIGKRRTSRNAYRHGLTASATSRAKFAKRIEKLARKIAGNTTDVMILECARDAAQAVFDLAQIRRVKVALIERMSALGELEEAPEQPERAAAAATMPAEEPERLAEAVRRALPELLKLDRYERRAAVVRERSVRAIEGRVKSFYNY